MLTEDQLARPWGEVAADFWAVPTPEPEPEHHDEPVAYTVPPVYAAARQSAPPTLPGPSPAPAVDRVPSAVIAPQAPAPQPMPAAYRDRIEDLAKKLSRPQTNLQMMLAESEAQHLDAEITAAFGPADQNTINIRELRGMISHLQGNPAAAARWHLHTTGLQAGISGTGHDLTKASARRAYAMWTAIRDPAERAAVGAEILPMLTVVAGSNAKPTKAVQKFLGG
ncbi:hypothetical protein OG618_37565 (plasmid) [Kitasatospora sp. NBC_01246]|uniref:hypothetical protein n=1 Tax=Kitasatospora sp. NBC_01246 TaxID=2903570 RepID=UPI002E2FBB11|nr:hypothetical protein [Kitasatospora sp. NBC_01246]